MPGSSTSGSCSPVRRALANREGGHGPRDRDSLRARGLTVAYGDPAGCLEAVTAMLDDYDHDQLVCAHARVVTDRGIWVCPILLDVPDGNLGDDLTTAARAPFALSKAACHTCWLHGAICSNPGAAAPETPFATTGVAT